jgi:hypothetical protein
MPGITGVAEPGTTTGVDSTTTGVDANESPENAGVGINTDNDRARIQQEMDERYGPKQHSTGLRDRKPHSYNHLYGDTFDYDHALLNFEEPLGELFLTEQMSLKKGLK